MTTKNLDFLGEYVGFMFQPRKPLTRLQPAKGVMASKRTQVTDKGKKPMIENIIDLSPAKEDIIVQRKGKEKVVKKTEVQMLKITVKRSQRRGY